MDRIWHIYRAAADSKRSSLRSLPQFLFNTVNKLFNGKLSFSGSGVFREGLCQALFPRDFVFLVKKSKCCLVNEIYQVYLMALCSLYTSLLHNFLLRYCSTRKHTHQPSEYATARTHTHLPSEYATARTHTHLPSEHATAPGQWFDFNTATANCVTRIDDNLQLQGEMLSPSISSDKGLSKGGPTSGWISSGSSSSSSSSSSSYSS